MELTINGKSSKDWGCDFTHKKIETPQPKTKYIDIPYADGKLDITDSMDISTRYANRYIDIEMELRQPRIMWAQFMREFCNEYNGEVVKVTFSDDPNYYWTGRASVGDLVDNKSTATITMRIDAEPFRYTLEPIATEIVEPSASAPATFTFLNEHKRCFPSFEYKTAGTVSVRVNYDTAPIEIKALASNANQRYLMMDRGPQSLTFIGNGKLAVDIYGGDL